MSFFHMYFYRDILAVSPQAVISFDQYQRRTCLWYIYIAVSSASSCSRWTRGCLRLLQARLIFSVSIAFFHLPAGNMLSLHYMSFANKGIPLRMSYLHSNSGDTTLSIIFVFCGTIRASPAQHRTGGSQVRPAIIWSTTKHLAAHVALIPPLGAMLEHMLSQVLRVIFDFFPLRNIRASGYWTAKPFRVSRGGRPQG